MIPLRFRFSSALVAAAAAAALFLPFTVALRAGPGTAVASAGTDKNVTKNVAAKEEEKTSLDLFEVDSSYVGSADFKDQQFGGAGGRPGRSYGDQSEYHLVAAYSHRFLLKDKFYLRLGVNYERFDFSKSFAPVPTTLQSAAGVIALEYVVQNRPAVFLLSKPGLYFSNAHNLGTGNFDAPTTLAVTFEGTRIYSSLKNVYFVAGVRGSILSKYPVLPIGGLVWLISDRWRLEAIPPEPQLIFKLNDKIDLFVGGEILGESYKRDRNKNASPQDQRFNEAVVDYFEYRLGGGVSYNLTKKIELDFSGGYVPRRTFDYFRGEGDGKRFKTDGAPYAKVAVKAEF